MICVFSTEDLNGNGYRVLTSGIDLERYYANPVLLHEHNDWSSSIGKVNNLRIENGNLIGEPEFDEEDEYGKALKRKYEKGYQRGFSIGIEIVELSNDMSALVPGQTRPTVKRCQLLEISCVTIPANQNAVRLYKDGNLLQLGLGDENLNKILPKIKTETMVENKPKTEKTDYSAAEIVERDLAIQRLEAENAKLTKERDAAIDCMLNLAKKTGVVTDQNKESYDKLAKQDIGTTAQLLLAAQTKKERVSDKLQPGKSETDKVTESFDYLQKNNPSKLAQLRKEQPEVYAELYRKHFPVRN